MHQDQRIRLGVIGCGSMQELHQHAYHALSDRIVVTAMADVSADRARSAANAVGADKFVTDYRELLDDVDAVLVALPNHLHHSVGVECLKAGKHVLMEKPLVTSEADALDLIETARIAERVLMTAYPLRYHPVVTGLQEAVADERYGKLFSLSLITEQFHQYSADDWRGSPEKRGGGEFFTHGCHYVDLMLWFLGRPVRGSLVGVRNGTPWAAGEGTSMSAIEFDDGSIGWHYATIGARGARRRGATIQAIYTEGTLEAQVGTGQLYLHTEDGSELLFECEGGLKYTDRELAHFLDCIAEGREPLTSGPGSLQGLRVIWRLYEAERRGLLADLRGLGLDEPWQSPGMGALPGRADGLAATAAEGWLS